MNGWKSVICSHLIWYGCQQLLHNVFPLLYHCVSSLYISLKNGTGYYCDRCSYIAVLRSHTATWFNRLRLKCSSCLWGKLSTRKSLVCQTAVVRQMLYSTPKHIQWIIYWTEISSTTYVLNPADGRDWTTDAQFEWQTSTKIVYYHALPTVWAGKVSAVITALNLSHLTFPFSFSRDTTVKAVSHLWYTT